MRNRSVMVKLDLTFHLTLTDTMVASVQGFGNSSFCKILLQILVRLSLSVRTGSAVFLFLSFRTASLLLPKFFSDDMVKSLQLQKGRQTPLDHSVHPVRIRTS